MEHAGYAFRRGRGEYERLIDQAEIFRPLTEQMLRSAGIRAGMHVVDIGLQPHPTPPAEFVLCLARDNLAYRRWAQFVRSMLPKIVEYRLGTEEEIRHRVEHDLREELLAANGLVPLSWLMIGQWARVPAQ